MATLVWHEAGDKVYQSGVDKGVLYLSGIGVSWNGLLSVDEDPSSERKSFFLDGVKYLEAVSPSEFKGKLKAFTYPDEFDQVNGIESPATGLDFHEQKPKSFSLSYRTRIGNDLEGFDYGYKIHILYDVIATPENYGFETLSDSSVKPIEFTWDLAGTPIKFNQIKPVVHISIDSTKTSPERLEALENMLYGTESTPPTLPTLVEVAQIFGYIGTLTIVDHGDGTWSAIDLGNEFVSPYISMLNSTTFQIENADATFLDANTYEISDTDLGWEG